MNRIQKATAAFKTLRHFINQNQKDVLARNVRSEEGEYFAALLADFAALVDIIPTTGQTDGQGAQAVAYLHYFTSSADFYITEKDAGSPDDAPETGQIQAFGLADLYRDGGELGYISLPEIFAAGAELDLHFNPRPLAEIRAEREFETAKVTTTPAKPSREEEFNQRLSELLAAIKEKAEAQFKYNETRNIPAGIIQPADSVNSAVSHGIVAAWNNIHSWSIEPAFQLAAEICEDVNAHTEAAYLHGRIKTTVAA